MDRAEVRTPHQLSGTWNFRDVAESTSNAVRPGLLFRSGELTKLDDAGRGQLRAAGITDVADLRSPAEVQRHGPGLVPPGVEIHPLPFVEAIVAEDGDAPHEQAFKRIMADKPDGESIEAATVRYMLEEYDQIAASRGARRAVRRVITLLGDGRRVLAHCFAGKDRTGFTVAVVLDAVGVDRDTIMADYLASNSATGEIRAQIIDMVERRFGGAVPDEAQEFTAARLSDDVLGVRAEYLARALAGIEAEFGSVPAYLRAAEVTDEEVARLRSALTG